ncbi:MAG TPA: O-antigen ligase family protein, partial [Polyangiaceae bacterium]|nr:O-antigen ligase family protein [Polyangiaceae bacterium]
MTVARSVSRPRNVVKAADRAARMTRWLEIATLVGVYGGLLMPLVFARIVIYPYVYLKMLYFQLLIGLTFPAWVSLAVRDSRYRIRGTWLVWAVLGWFAAMGASTVFAANPWRAFFGTQDRMTGLFSLLHFLAWYLMAASVLQAPRDWRRLFDAQLGVGFLSACAVLLQLAFPNLIGSREIQEGERLSGLLGNPIFSAAYQAFSIYVVLYLWKDAIPKMRVWYVVVVGMATAAIIAAGSRGPMLGLAVGLTFTVLLTAFVTRHRRIVLYFSAISTLLVLGYFSVVVFAVHRPSLGEFWRLHFNLKHFFDFEVDGSRALLWTAALEAFIKQPIVGWGPAGFEIAFDVVYRPEYHPLAIQDEAHNRLLGVLSETGLVGLCAYLALWVTYFLACGSAIRHRTLQPLQGAALVGAGAGHFTQCLFAFDTPATQLMTYLLFAVATCAAVAQLPVASEQKSSWVSAYQKWVPLGTVPALVYAMLLLGTLLPGAASVYARRASSAAAQGKPDQMLSLLAQAHRVATPYRDDQLLVLTRGILRVAKANRFENWSGRKASLALVHSVADSYFLHESHPRLRRIYANMLF